MCGTFRAVISKEIKEQILQKEGRLPDAVIACVGGGSNAIGSFYHFIEDQNVRLIGCEAAGRGIDTFETAATIATGRPGYLPRYEITTSARISTGRSLLYTPSPPDWIIPVSVLSTLICTTRDAQNMFPSLMKKPYALLNTWQKTEGIIPAIESAHAVAHAIKLAPGMSRDQIIVITISGRGDKDCAAIARYRGEDIHE